MPTSDAYLHDDRADIDNSKWMSALDDKTTWQELSLIGTHDSLSFYGSDSVQTQSMSLANQLKAGVRGFDVRCRPISGRLAIHHGIVFQKTMLGDVLTTMASFLEANPGETLLVNFHGEKVDSGDDPQGFEKIFPHYKGEFSGSFWQCSTGNSFPMLGETRGRIVTLDDIRGAYDPATDNGFACWESNLVYLGGPAFNSNWDLYAVWEGVRNSIRLANDTFGRCARYPDDPVQFGALKRYCDGCMDKRVYMRTGTAVNGGGFPYFGASGHSSPGTDDPRLLTGLLHLCNETKWPDFPRIAGSIAFEGLNNLIHQYVLNNKPTYVGQLWMDFPGNGLIDTIIKLNDRFRKLIHTEALILCVGTATIGAQISASPSKTTAITLPSLPQTPLLFTTARGDGAYGDTFATSTLGIGASGFSVNGARVDLGSGVVTWGQSLLLGWLAMAPTVRAHMKCGIIRVGSSNNQRLTVTGSFPQAFAASPRVILTARGQAYGDTFMVSTNGVSTSGFSARMLRTDYAGGWGQDMSVDWLAFDSLLDFAGIEATNGTRSSATSSRQEFASRRCRSPSRSRFRRCRWFWSRRVARRLTMHSPPR